jgi:uncharacterized protein
MRRSARLVPLAVAWSATVSAASASPLPPRPTRHATDRAGVFDTRRLAALDERLAAFERATSSQVVVYVDRRVPPGTTLEEMSVAALRSWGVGQRKHDNGVLFFVFVDDRVMRIEVGYGLEGTIPDIVAKRITSQTVKPFFRRGDYPGGVEAGIDRILAAARGEAFAAPAPPKPPARPRARPAAGPLPPLGLSPQRRALTFAAGAALSLVLLLLARALGRWSVAEHLGAYSGAFMATWGSTTAGLMLVQGDEGFLALAVLLTGLLLLLVILSGRAGDERSGSDDSASSCSADSSYESSSPSESSSSFTGGGGDGGGGGASDRW